MAAVLEVAATTEKAATGAKAADMRAAVKAVLLGMRCVVRSAASNAAKVARWKPGQRVARPRAVEIAATKGVAKAEMVVVATTAVKHR